MAARVRVAPRHGESGWPLDPATGGRTRVVLNETHSILKWIPLDPVIINLHLASFVHLLRSTCPKIDS